MATTFIQKANKNPIRIFSTTFHRQHILSVPYDHHNKQDLQAFLHTVKAAFLIIFKIVPSTQKKATKEAPIEPKARRNKKTANRRIQFWSEITSYIRFRRWLGFVWKAMYVTRSLETKNSQIQRMEVILFIRQAIMSVGQIYLCMILYYNSSESSKVSACK